MRLVSIIERIFNLNVCQFNLNACIYLVIYIEHDALSSM